MSAIGALIGLILSILLIIKKLSPCYSLLLGALIGGLIGGFGLVGTVSSMIGGVRDIVPAIVRILAAGVLSGVLIETGAAESIAKGLVRSFGAKRVYWALAISTFLLCAVGVFIDVAVITVAPIAMLLAGKTGQSGSKLLLMMIAGGKCGNIISTNPNTIIAAENFGADLPSVMAANVIPAIVGLFFSVWVLSRLFERKEVHISLMEDIQLDVSSVCVVPFWAAIVGPLVTILLLALRPLAGWVIDPLIALPIGGLVGLLIMRQGKRWKDCLECGLSKMAPIAVLLVGTGAIAGVVKDSSLTEYLIQAMGTIQGGEYLLAPLSGILLCGATASTTAGATIASGSFAPTIIATGISPVWGAAMVNAGATVIDHLPHGSFFHATGGSMELTFKERMRLIPFESVVGLVLTAMSVLCCWMWSNLL